MKKLKEIARKNEEKGYQFAWNLYFKLKDKFEKILFFFKRFKK
jgi:hypothetical protein